MVPPPIICIHAVNLSDAWYKAVKECLKVGSLKKREYGLTRDVISIIEINNPLQEPLLHPDFPTKGMHLNEYVKQFEREYNWKERGFEYNYVDRMVNYPTTDIRSRDDGYYKAAKRQHTESIDQAKIIYNRIADRIEKGGECLTSNRDQLITWVVERDLFVDEDQPCLQRIQIFIYSFPYVDDKNNIIPGKGEIVISWRSRDLYAAWNSNLIAIISFINKEIFTPNHIRMIRIVDFCSSLHIYDTDWEEASKIKPVPIMQRSW